MARRCLVGWAAAVLLSMTVVLPPLAGQQRPRIWLGTGFGGAGGGNSTGGAAVMAEVVYQRGVHQVGVRAVGVTDVFGYSDSELGELGLLYGRSATRVWGHASISAGLAWTKLGSCGESGGDCSTLGVPIVAEAAVRLFSILGVGAQAFVNVNAQNVYRGAVLFLQLGWLP